VSESIESGIGFRRPDSLRIAAHYRGTELEPAALLLEDGPPPEEPDTIPPPGPRGGRRVFR
jgi:hypothetical protein